MELGGALADLYTIDPTVSYHSRLWIQPFCAFQLPISWSHREGVWCCRHGGSWWRSFVSPCTAISFGFCPHDRTNVLPIASLVLCRSFWDRMVCSCRAGIVPHVSRRVVMAVCWTQLLWLFEDEGRLVQRPSVRTEGISALTLFMFSQRKWAVTGMGNALFSSFNPGALVNSMVGLLHSSQANGLGWHGFGMKTTLHESRLLVQRSTRHYAWSWKCTSGSIDIKTLFYWCLLFSEGRGRHKTSASAGWGECAYSIALRLQHCHPLCH